MQNICKRLFDTIEENKQKILEAEEYIWKHPEIGYREWNTTRYIAEHMKTLGLEVHECGDIPGLWVDIDMEGEGPRLAIFAEMDGLYIPDHPDADPETGAVHACAHHCQCAAMIGLATALAADGALDGMCGSVRLFAVPAEEGIELDYRAQLIRDGVIKYHGGKQEFLWRGYLDDVDIAMMVHTCSKGIMCNVGSNGFISKRMTFIGKASHGASPERGLNALYAATNAIAATNSLRELFGGDKNFRFHPIIAKGGDAVNVIPSEVVVESFTRGADMKTIIAANEKINRAFASSAAALGCRLIIEDSHGSCPRKDDPNMIQAVYEAGKLLMPEEDLRMNGAWAAGCTDMGDVSAVLPSVHAHIGAGPLPGHTSTFKVIDHETATVTNAKLQAGIIAHLFSNGAENAKKVIAEAKLQYKSFDEYFADTEKASFHGESVFYGEDGTVTIKYKK